LGDGSFEYLLTALCTSRVMLIKDEKWDKTPSDNMAINFNFERMDFISNRKNTRLTVATIQDA
jgi:hypothetical protein